MPADKTMILKGLYGDVAPPKERATRGKMQNYRAFLSYFTASEWTFLMKDTPPLESKLSVVVEKLLSLEGRCLSEPTKKFVA